jgi:hypothetical protein
MNFDDLFSHSSSFWDAQLVVKNTPTGEFIIYVQHHQPIGSAAHNSSRTTIQETKEKPSQNLFIFLFFMTLQSFSDIFGT